MRLDRFLSQQLGMSRSLITRELRACRVTVDGSIVKDGAVKITHQQTVTCGGNLLHQPLGHRYFMLNKPQCYVCSTTDPHHPTVLHLLDEPAAHKLHTVGRLDIDTTGLVLLTDDGQWSHRVTSPKYHCEKTYLVTLKYPIIVDDIVRQFMAGVQLRGEKTLTKPAQLIVLQSGLMRLTLSEGRYHQVKRMFAACGNLVTNLHRERIGKIILDDSLAAGQYRSLTEQEITSMAVSRR